MIGWIIAGVAALIAAFLLAALALGARYDDVTERLARSLEEEK